jgi:hypothetical protein
MNMTSVSRSSVEPRRVLLEHVPKVHFYEGGARCPEDLCFASVMRAIVEYLGETDYGCRHGAPITPKCKVSCTYSFMLGVTGTAFFLSWGQGWQMDNVEIMYMSDDPAAPSRRAFEAIGYAQEYIDNQLKGEAYTRRRIIESLRDKARPVIAYGIIGPPEACMITGYDEGGEVLMGWSFFQKDPSSNAGVTFEPTGQFRKRDWFKALQGLHIIGEKGEKPSLSATYRSALQWGVDVARRQRVTTYGHERAVGLAAYTAWAETICRDEDLPVDNEALLRERHFVHDNLVGILAEARWYGSQFLVGMTERGDVDVHRSTIEDLYHAAGYWAGIHDLMWEVWDLAGGNGNPEGWKKFADPAVRRQIAAIILQARDKDARAVEHLERALALWK